MNQYHQIRVDSTTLDKVYAWRACESCQELHLLFTDAPMRWICQGVITYLPATQQICDLFCLARSDLEMVIWSSMMENPDIKYSDGLMDWE